MTYLYTANVCGQSTDKFRLLKFDSTNSAIAHNFVSMSADSAVTGEGKAGRCLTGQSGCCLISHFIAAAGSTLLDLTGLSRPSSAMSVSPCSCFPAG